MNAAEIEAAIGTLPDKEPSLFRKLVPDMPAASPWWFSASILVMAAFDLWAYSGNYWIVLACTFVVGFQGNEFLRGLVQACQDLRARIDD